MLKALVGNKCVSGSGTRPLHIVDEITQTECFYSSRSVIQDFPAFLTMSDRSVLVFHDSFIFCYSGAEWTEAANLDLSRARDQEYCVQAPQFQFG